MLSSKKQKSGFFFQPFKKLFDKIWVVVRFALKFYSIFLLMLIWELLANSGWVNPRIFPTLGAIWSRLILMWNNGDLIYHSQFTLERAMLGLGLALLVGMPLGLWMGRVSLVERLFDPLFSLGYPVPKIAFYPVFIFLLGIDTEPKVALVFLECLFPIVLNTFFGARQVNRTYLWAARNMGASKFEILRKVVLPSAAPSIFTGFRIALPISLIVVIITEMISSSTGLGYLISYSASSFRISAVFAGIVVIGLLGFLLDRLTILIRNRLIFWEARPN